MSEQTGTASTDAPQDPFHFLQYDRRGCEALARELSVPYLVAVLLWQRDIQDAKVARSFLHPRLADLPSPLLMKNMETAVLLIEQALEEEWKICIHGDYDVDGITGTALLSRFFRILGRETACFQPNRLKEGYGLQESFIRAQAPDEEGKALLITVDCGISDYSQVKLAREKGFRVIVTDHHLPGEKLPPADVILNPRQENCSFPYPELAGVGVAFFLACGVRNHLVQRGIIRREQAPNLKGLMDLAALGTVADVMPVTGTNRIIVRAGLEVMNMPECSWSRALQEEQGRSSHSGSYSTEDISYKFAPRINAPGRLGRPDLAFDLLSNSDPVHSREIAAEIEQLNTHRRTLESEATRLVLEECERQEQLGCSAFVASGDFHQGVIGIIASRAVDRYRKPVIVFTDDLSQPGTMKGSGRSVAAVNLFDTLQECAESVIQFGGHAMAAGLTIEKERLTNFARKFEQAVAARPALTGQAEPMIISYSCTPDELLHDDFLTHYRDLEPFGNGNPEPVFLFKNPEFVKKNIVKSHLTFSLKANNRVFRGIGFGMADKAGLLEQGPVQLAFKVKRNGYRGADHIELHAQDIRPAG